MRGIDADRKPDHDDHCRDSDKHAETGAIQNRQP
jgi:hypothetical protein